MSKSLINKGLKDGTNVENDCLITTETEIDTNQYETALMFQTKYRSVSCKDSDENEVELLPPKACILPSGWGKRLKKPGPVHKWSKAEVMEYNEMVFLHGEQAAKAWADRRWNERNTT